MQRLLRPSSHFIHKETTNQKTKLLQLILKAMRTELTIRSEVKWPNLQNPKRNPKRIVKIDKEIFLTAEDYVHQ